MKKLFAVLLSLLLLCACGAQSPAPTAVKATPWPPPTPIPDPVTAATDFDRYALNVYPGEGLNVVGADEHWPDVVDAIFARRESLDTLPADKALLCAQTFINYHLMGTLVQEAAVQNDVLTITYRYDADEHSQLVTRLVDTVEGLLQTVMPEGSNRLEQMILCYQVACQQSEYDIDAPITNAFGLLLFRTGICHGWAELYSQLLLQCGIDSIRVQGETLDGQEHGWVVAQIGENWYHFDPMWDNPDQGRDLFYFALSDQARAMRGGGVKLPVTGTLDPFPPMQVPACNDDSFTQRFEVGMDFVVDVESHQLIYALRVDNSMQMMSTES